MPTPFIDGGQCSVYVSNTYDTCGTLTRAALTPLGTDAIRALYINADTGTYNEMTASLRSQVEIQMCGVKRNTMADLLASMMIPKRDFVRPEKIDRGPSLIAPFIMARQLSQVNDEDWSISAGWKTAAGAPYNTGTVYTANTTGPLTSLTGGDRVIRVSPVYGVTPDAQYFLARYKVFILALGSGGTVKMSSYKIVSAALDTAATPTYVDVLITGSTDDTARASFDFAPTSGRVVLMPNDVHDPESYCRNRINYNNVKFVPFWFQPMRHGRQWCSQTLEVAKALIADNKYFETFINIPEVERTRQDEDRKRREFANAFFFQEKGNSNQTSVLWKNLPQITSLSGASVDPGTGSQLIEYAADLEGVVPQLRTCGQVHDYQNAPLSIATWIDTYLYPLDRAREGNGRNYQKEIDVITDSQTAREIRQAFMGTGGYYDSMIAGFRATMDLGMHKNGKTPMGWNFSSYILERPAITLNVIVAPFFDDVINALGAASQSAGRFLMAIDWSTIRPFMVASNERTSVVGNLSDLEKVDLNFACVLTNPTATIKRMSETVGVMVTCGLQSRVDHGFSNVQANPA